MIRLSEMTMTFHGVGKLKAQKDAMGKAQTIEEMTRSAKFAGQSAGKSRFVTIADHLQPGP